MIIVLFKILYIALLSVNIFVFTDGIVSICIQTYSLFDRLQFSLINSGKRSIAMILLGTCYLGYRLYYVAALIHNRMLYDRMRRTLRRIGKNESEVSRLIDEISELSRELVTESHNLDT